MIIEMFGPLKDDLGTKIQNGLKSSVENLSCVFLRHVFKNICFKHIVDDLSCICLALQNVFRMGRDIEATSHAGQCRN